MSQINKTQNLRIIGNIAGFHGVRGEIKIYPLLDDIELFKSIKVIYIEEPPQNTLKQYQIEKTRPHKKFILVKLKGLNSLNSVEHLSGYIQAELNEELEENEFYIEDLNGLNVIDKHKDKIGKITRIEDEGQTRVHIHLDSKFNAKRELIVPLVKEYITRVDLEAKELEINLTDELLELAL